ncbi:MAG: phosphatidate cytidylyltransferase [Xanthobacteraceae bacterium]
MTVAPADLGVRRIDRGARGRQVDLLRIGSALVLAPLAVGTAYAGGWLFALFWGLAAVAMVWEWMSLVDRQHWPREFAGGGFSLALALVLLGLNRALAAMIVVGVGAVGSGLLAGSQRRLWIAAGVLYGGAFVVALTALRADPQWGLLAILLLFALVWTTDIAGYFAGRALQGPKLWPRVSPNKTWSGAFVGTLAAVIAAIVVAKLAGLGHVWPIAALGGALSIVGQAGDLLESGIKRRFGVKDASHIIPGHGGVMDRLDAFWAASVAGALLGFMRAGLDAPARGLLLW